MVFTSLVFIFRFLPIVLVFYFISPKKIQNLVLLCASLFFYAWGEPRYISLLILSIIINFILGLALDKTTHKKILLIVAIIFNLGLLGYFKYFNFFSDLLNSIFSTPVIPMKSIMLPIGISFFTFQNISYISDLYRKQICVQKNIINFALYISFFPQLIAGPIVKYHDIAQLLEKRQITSEGFAKGIQRFCTGLAKKVILANQLGEVVDKIYQIPFDQQSTAFVWTAAVFYTLQIYYDFSGYSDMAIGLANMFGFTLKENFNFPYISTSIKEFWRRWHISLSTWFREYLYIPLGGNRHGRIKTYINLFLVFLCTGLWHGASLNFVVWGLWHGSFLTLERFIGENKFLSTRIHIPVLFKYVYTMLVVIIGWVFFRAPDLRFVKSFLLVMIIPRNDSIQSFYEIVNPESIVVFFIAVLLLGWFQTIRLTVVQRPVSIYTTQIVNAITNFLYLVLFIISVIFLVNNTYNPFIYFRF